jgi:hypothetical protein
MNDVSSRCVSMVRRLLVKSGLVMFGRLSVVTSGVRKMFRCFLVVFRGFLPHSFSIIKKHARLGGSRLFKIAHLILS